MPDLHRGGSAGTSARRAKTRRTPAHAEGRAATRATREDDRYLECIPAANYEHRSLLVHAESQQARAFHLHLVPEFERSPTDQLHLVSVMGDVRRTVLGLFSPANLKDPRVDHVRPRH